MSQTPDVLHWWLDTNATFDDCQRPAELLDATSLLIRQMGFDCFAHGRRRPVPFSETRIRFAGTYPSAWLEQVDDPGPLRPGSFLWGGQAPVIGNLHGFGYASGATCVTRSGEGDWHLLCVARHLRSIDADEGLAVKLQLRSLLELLGEHLQRVEGSYPAIDLSDRETQVLRWLADGEGSKGIAARLQLSEHTVNFHIKNILRKFDSPNRTLAAARAAALGLI
ncbi:MAG: LuxR C-terminal-related transcriptional regulator [Paucimonas sp.]|jgi:DNA-binding CsgD family transcriptional regulator|nr:LuxR C-terminal-related transcriptional regulator [Paucimonas sp.]